MVIIRGDRLLALNHTAGQTGTRIASWLGVKVIGVSVHDQAFAQNVMITFAQCQLGGLKLHDSQAIGIGLQAG